MPAPIQVVFRVGGVNEVQRAFQNVEKAAENLEKRSRKASDDDVARSRKATDAKEKEFAKLARWADRETQRQKREAEKAAASEVSADQKKSNAKIRAEEAWARQRARIQENSAKLAYKLAEDEVRATEKAEQAKARARERWGRSMGRTVGGSVGGLVHGATRMAGTALALGGGFGLADIVQQQFAAERAAAQLVNAVTSTGSAPAGANVGSILSQAGSIAIKTGMSKEDVVKGALSYSRSARGGDFGGAMGNMEFFAKMSKTTGTSIEDLAQAAGTLQSQNPDLGKGKAGQELMQQMLLGAYAQTKSGSVSLVDAAKQFGTLGSTRGFYQGNEAKNQMTLLGLGQIAAAGGSSEEIGTFIKDLSTEAAQHRHAKGKFVGLENMGVKFDKSGRMESPEQMIGAVFKATKGDLGQIGEIFGKRGLPLFSELSRSFRDAGGGDKGVSAVMGQIHGVTGSTMSTKDLDTQFNQVMNTHAEKFAQAQQRVTEILQEKLTPYLDRFADKLPELIPKLEKMVDVAAKFADLFIDHPIAGIGAIIAAQVAKDVAAAQIGELLKRLLGGGGGGGAGGGGGGKGGNALPLITAGVVGLTAADAWINTQVENESNRKTAFGRNVSPSLNMISKLKSGNASAQDIAEAEKLQKQMRADETALLKGDQSNARGGLSAMLGMVNPALGLFNYMGMGKGSEESKKQDRANAERLDKSIQDLTKAIEAASKANGNPANPNRNVPISAAPRGGTQ